LIKALRLSHERAAQALDLTARALPIRTQHDRLIIQMAFLAPDIQQAILAGRQPRDLTLAKLRTLELPLQWSEQRALFGF
jgi:site-specific DNA recombinase